MKNSKNKLYVFDLFKKDNLPFLIIIDKTQKIILNS